MSEQINKHEDTMNNDRKIMIKGSIWMTLSTAISRSGSLIAQIILGMILVEEDFALYALAISASTLIFTLKSGGARQLLIKNGENYNSIASIYFKYAFIFNLTAMAMLILIAPVAAKIYGEDEISGLIYIVAIAIPISTPAMLFRARLAIQKRFGTIAKLDMISNLTRQVSMIGLALAGFGAYSFVIPIVIVSIIEVAIGWWYVRSWPPSVKINHHKFNNIMKDAKWVMIGSLAIGLSLQGDFLVIGLYEELKVIGLYFFGYQLVYTITTFFNSALETVLPPMLTRLIKSKDVFRELYLFSITATLAVSILIAVPLILLSPSIISFIWQGKWDDSTVVIQILSLSIPFWFLVTISRSVLEAQGKWIDRMYLYGAYGIGGMLFAGIGAYFGGLIHIAIAVCIYRVIFPVTQSIYISRKIGITYIEFIKAFLIPVILAVISYILSHYLIEVAFNVSNESLYAALTTLSFSITYILLTGYIHREHALIFLNKYRSR